MMVQKLVYLVRRKLLPEGREPDVYWTGVITAVLALLNLAMILFFLFSQSGLKLR